MNCLWLKLQDEIDVNSGGHTEINSARKRILAGRDYTSSVVSQVLSICEKIDDETLQRLNVARRKRNNFAHDLTHIGADDSGEAIRLATDMVTNMAGVTVTSQLSLYSWI